MNDSQSHSFSTRNIITFPGDDFEPDLFSDHFSHREEESLIRETEECTHVEKPPPPYDKHGAVYIVFYLLGTSTLLPWYFFVTCNNYWMYRFRSLPHTNVSIMAFLPYILDDPEDATNRTSLQADFTSYISIASTVPSTIFLFFNVFFFSKCSIHWRIVISAIVLLALFIETTALVLVDTDSWQYTFFIITLLTVVLLNMSTALLQAALCGIIMKFPVSYVTAFSSGQSLAGIFAAVALISSLFVEFSPVTSTFVYFVFADITILVSFVGYLIIRRTEFFNYCAGTSEVIGSIQFGRGNQPSVGRIDYYNIQRKIWIPSLGLFLTYVVTTAIYPSIAALVCSVDVGIPSAWNDKFFVPVVTYLLYCVCEYSGRIIAGLLKRPVKLKVIWLAIARISFIPLLMLCNAQPRHHLPILIHSDVIYTLTIVFLAISNGYLTNLTFILIPKYVLQHELEVASTMLVTWLGAALSIGSFVSLLLINML